MKRFVVWVMTACVLAGCVTTPPHSLTVQDIGSWKLVDVEGTFADNARVNWPKVEDAFIDANLPRGPETTSEDDNGRLVTRPGERPAVTDEVRRAARLHAQAQFTDRTRRHMEPLGAAMAGQRPVKIRTTLHRLDVPTLGRQIVAGAIMAVAFGAGAATAQNRSTMEVSTVVVDAKTEAVLVSYPQRTLTRQGGEASGVANSTDPYVGDAVASMLGEYKNEFGRWLVKQ